MARSGSPRLPRGRIKDGDPSMSILARTLFTAVLAALLAAPAIAAPGNLAPGGGFKIYKAQLGITGDDGSACPAHKTLMGWVYMSHQATVDVMVFRKGKTIPSPVPITSVKASNGQYVATFTQQMLFFSPDHSEYRMLVGGGSGVASNWVTVDITC
jgi:hypothetical protein